MQDPEPVNQLKESLPEALFEKLNGSFSIDQDRLKLTEYKVRVLEQNASGPHREVRTRQRKTFRRTEQNTEDRLLRFCFDSAMRKHGVIDAAADDAKRGRGLQRIGILIAAERDDGQLFSYAADEQHCLLATDTMFARHPGQRRVDFG